VNEPTPAPPQLIAVDDPDDERIALFHRNERLLMSRTSKRRDGSGMFLAEGDLVVERALQLGCRPVAALVDGERVPPVASRLGDGVPLYAGGDALRARVTGMGAPQPIVAVFERPPRATLASLAAATHLVVIEDLDNPANVGSVARNALALGWKGLVLDHTSADPLSRRALRVSMGQAIALPHTRVEHLGDALGHLHDEGFTTVALTIADDAVPLSAVRTELRADERVAVVIGSERAGLQPDTATRCTWRARIPMHHGVDSLNAAAASAVACYMLGPPT
jgi:tRNA G18 (ribose-2'-O)-methylase SpoU